MIQVKITKNINKPTTFFLNLTLGQIITLLVAFAVGVATFLLLYQYVDFNLLMGIVFLEIIAIIFSFIIKINGMGLLFYLIKKLKGPEKRCYSISKGVYDDENDLGLF